MGQVSLSLSCVTPANKVKADFSDGARITAMVVGLLVAAAGVFVALQMTVPIAGWAAVGGGGALALAGIALKLVEEKSGPPAGDGAAAKPVAVNWRSMLPEGFPKSTADLFPEWLRQTLVTSTVDWKLEERGEHWVFAIPTRVDFRSKGGEVTNHWDTLHSTYHLIGTSAGGGLLVGCVAPKDTDVGRGDMKLDKVAGLMGALSSGNQYTLNSGKVTQIEENTTGIAEVENQEYLKNSSSYGWMLCRLLAGERVARVDQTEPCLNMTPGSRSIKGHWVFTPIDATS